MSTIKLLSRLAGLGEPAKSSAIAALATPPTRIDGGAWFDEHERLSYALLYAVARGNIGPIAALGQHDREVTAAHTALLAHARLISGVPEPILLARDGVHTIDYRKLSDARAKIQVLEEELAKLRALRPAGAKTT